LIYIGFIALRKNEAGDFFISKAGSSASLVLFTAPRALGTSPEFCTNSVDKSVRNTPPHALSH
jgi:hypothetical protein